LWISIDLSPPKEKSIAHFADDKLTRISICPVVAREDMDGIKLYFSASGWEWSALQEPRLCCAFIAKVKTVTRPRVLMR